MKFFDNHPWIVITLGSLLLAALIAAIKLDYLHACGYTGYTIWKR